MADMRVLKRMTLILLGTMLVSSVAVVPAMAAVSPSDISLNSPIRSIQMAPTATKADLNIAFDNPTNQDHLVDLTLKGAPTGWDVGVWDRFFSYKVTQLVVAPNPAPSDTTAPPQPTYTLRMMFPSTRPDPGKYSVTLIVTDAQDPSIEYDRATYTVIVPPPAVDTGTATAKADYPNLQGPSNTSYSYEIDVKNGTSTDHSFALAAQVLDANQQPVQGNWTLTFSPAFGASKTIQSVAVSANLDQRVDVNITPPSTAAAGDYYIPFTATSEDGTLTATQMLRLRIVGHGTLSASTPSGNLSMNATAGKETQNTFRLTNTGTADLSNVSLTSNAPADWVITYKIPNNTVTSLPQGNQIDIPFTVQPPKDAVPGDYQVTLTGQGTNTSDSIDIRVTVSQSTIWGWLGIVLVVIVVGGLAGLFWRLGRR